MADNGVQSRQGGARVWLPPPLVFLAAIVAGWLLPGFRVHGHHPARIVLGVALIAGGLALGMPAFLRFRKTGQDPKPWMPSPELILHGPYRYTRNPMYVSMVLMTWGVAALAGHGWITLLALPALAVVHFSAVLPEERYLAARFGEPYTRYLRAVRRYF